MKKFTLFILSLFFAVGAMAQAETIVPSTSGDMKLYTLKSGNDKFMTSFTSLTNNVDNSGRFAFFAVEGKENAFKIYSVDRNVWVSYAKADSYTDGVNKAILVETQEKAEAWNVVKTGDYYTIAPYNTTGVAGRYWNFYGGEPANTSDNTTITVGFYNKNSDGGSKWFLTAAEAAEVIDINATLTNASGLVFTYTYKGIAGVTEPALKGGNCTLSNKNWNGNNFTADVEFLFPVSNADVENKVMICPFNSNVMYYKISGTEVRTTKTAPNKDSENVNEYIWAIYPSFKITGVTYTIKSIAADKYIYTEATSATHNGNTVIVSENATEFMLQNNNVFKLANGLELYFSTSSSSPADQSAGVWHSVHNGTANKIRPEFSDYVVTDNAGNVFEGKFDSFYGISTDAPAFTGDANYTLSNGTWNNNVYTAEIAFTFPVSKEDEEPNITMLSSWNNEKIWHAIGNDIKVQTENIEEARYIDLNCMWAIYPSIENGAISFSIKNIATDKYIYSEAEDESSILNKQGTVVLNDEPSKFEVVDNGDFKFVGKDKLYISINSVNDNDVYLGVHKATHGGTNVAAVTPAYFYLTLYTPQDGATLYTPWALTIDPEIITTNMTKYLPATAHTVVKVTEEYAIFSESLEVIPAGEAVFLNGCGTFKFNIVSESAVERAENNMLKGTVARTLITKPEDTECYVFSKIADSNELSGYEFAFYRAVIGKEGQENYNDKQFYNGAFKAYLEVPTSIANGTASFSFRFPDTTGVDEVVVENEVKTIFDLTGRRVEAITAPGIYIVGGKKVLVK